MEKKYSRNCPECGDIVLHTSIGSRSHCRNNKCRKCSDYNKDRARYKKRNGKWKGYNDLSMSYFNGVKQNAKKRNISFDITIEDVWKQFVNQNRKCIYTGLTLELPKRTRLGSGGTASLDRIDSSKGYVKGNVQWVHKDVNWMKQDFDQTYFMEMCNIISENSIRNIITPIDIFIKNSTIKT